MTAPIATIVVDRRSLVREALESLMASHSYRILCGVSSVGKIHEGATKGKAAALVLLSGMTAGEAVPEAAVIRELWPDSHIVFLFESVSIEDGLQLMISQVDGCVPLSASPDTLISTLNLVLSRDVRVMVVPEEYVGAAAARDRTDRFETRTMERPSPAERGGVPSAGTPSSTDADSMLVPEAGASGAACGEAVELAGLEMRPTLSDREAQILDGLVQGHANKVIARTWDITEATVKVHMKSILRKIRVANRTQAAIWALEHGYPLHRDGKPGDEARHRPAMSTA